MPFKRLLSFPDILHLAQQALASKPKLTASARLPWSDTMTKSDWITQLSAYMVRRLRVMCITCKALLCSIAYSSITSRHVDISVVESPIVGDFFRGL